MLDTKQFDLVNNLIRKIIKLSASWGIPTKDILKEYSNFYTSDKKNNMNNDFYFTKEEIILLILLYPLITIKYNETILQELLPAILKDYFSKSDWS